MKFEWDQVKARANAKKHGVTFDEARAVFFDDAALVFDDPDHSDEEDRFLLLGISSGRRVLLVVHCYRDHDEVVRIISARAATNRECERYMRHGRSQ